MLKPVACLSGSIVLATCLTALCSPAEEPAGRSRATGRSEESSTASLASARPVAEEVRILREQLAEQQEQIRQLREAMEAQGRLLQRLLEPPATMTRPAPGPEPAALTSPAISAALPAGSAGAQMVASTPPAEKPAEKKSDLSVAGFKFSGDFRFRLDAQLRSGNAVAGPLQNIRSRYRVRLNTDKELDRRFRFHLQLSTSPFNNEITNDQDFAGIAVKHPFSIAEAYVDFHPTSNFALRGGRMEEVFADNMRFLWDDDVRFNGFQQILSVRSGISGLDTLELRSGEYILSNPNVPVLAASSPFAAAGAALGKKVRDANLFHPGLLLKGRFSQRWNQQITGDIQLYRNANQIQLASTAAGFPVLVNPAAGFALAGPLTCTGNATTTPGGAMFWAPHFQVVRLAYRLGYAGWTLHRREMPAWLDVQASRNVGTARLRDAFMVSANLGNVKAAGDTRFLYQYTIKDANAFISQFTDDDLGTGSGVNIAVHALRFDLGLTRFLQWQNLFFVQTERRASNPAERFFVPLQRGAKPTFRFLGQLAFSF